MQIKTKLFTGIGSLFLLMVLLSVLSGYYINKLSIDTKNILTDNYNSIKYSHEMLMLLDEDMNESSTRSAFEKNLMLQQQNITETGEQSSTHTLTDDYNKLKSFGSDPILYSSLRKDLLNIIKLNMEVIQNKSNIAKTTADKAIFWIIIGGGLSLIIALFLLFFMPNNIVNPIKDFIKSIQHIAEINYDERININRNDEFNEMGLAFNTMAEKLKEYNNSNLAKVIIEKKRIEALVENIREPVIGLDEHFNILFMNNEALKITNLKSEDVIGKLAQDIAVKNDLIRTLIQDLFGNKSTPTILKIFADNKESYFQKEIVPMNIIPTGETAVQHIGNVIFLKNITSLKELDYAKTNFMAKVSHELEIPVYSIKMSTQMLENKNIGIINSEQYKSIQRINEDIEQLLYIIGELQDMTQIETGMIQLSIIPTNPIEILDYAINATKLQAEQKSIHLVTSVPEQIPRVFADREKTAWVLINLITNAIRYSYEGATVYLTITANDKNVLFSVRDTGQGILPEYQEKVFERYFKIPGGNKSGTGLGLAISKEFIEVQGGGISLKSEYGIGSEFIISLNKCDNDITS